MKYKLLCVDIDGTLASDDKSISQENKQALRQAYLAGIKIAIASGRSAISVSSLLEDIGIPQILICLNGAYIEVDGQEVSCHVFDSRQLNQAYQIVKKFNTNATFNTSQISIRNSDVSKEWKKQIEEGSLKADYLIANTQQEYENLIFEHQNEIVKISILERDMKKYELIRKAFEDTGMFSVVKSDVDYVDISDKKSTKGNGVITLAKYFHIPLSQVVCIGDNENDYDMLKVAGLAIAMKNATQSIKELADWITDDNNHNGVAKAIQKLLEEEE